MRCPRCQAEAQPDARFCAKCGAELPKPANGGLNLGDVGLIKEINIGQTEKASGPSGGYCPICGVWVKTEDSFRCKRCGRTGLHKEHRHTTLNVCVECAGELQPVEPPPPAAVAPSSIVQIQGDALTITLDKDIWMEFRRVPAGTFLMGSDGYDDEKPQHKVHLSEYWIGKAPVTNQQYQVFVDAVDHEAPEHWEDGIIPAGKEQHPVVYVSWHDARAFCAWLCELSGEDIHLPSEAEWEKAARGTKAYKYPWGKQEPDVGLCNYGQNIGDTTRVGRYSPAGDSPYGCVDMAGNVWEWTSSLYMDYPYKAGDGRENPAKDGDRVLRGGSWFDVEWLVRSAFRVRVNPSNPWYALGFRCARSS